MRITELFDNPAATDVAYAGEEIHQIRFSIEGRQYNAVIELVDDPGDWEVSFTMNNGDDWTDEATGTGSEFKVFSTIINFVVDFLNKHLNKVQRLVFTSDQESRTKLYARIAKLCAKRYGLKYMVHKPYGNVEFVLTNAAFE